MFKYIRVFAGSKDTNIILVVKYTQ